YSGYNIAFSSGSANTQYRVSMQYLDEEGIVLNSERQRISARLNLDHKMLDGKLNLAVRINPTFIKRDNTPYNQQAGFFGGVFTNVYKMNPTDAVRLSDGSFFEFPNTEIRNPVALLEEIDDESKTTRIFSNATLEYEFMPGLRGKVNLGLDRSSSNRSIYEPRSLPYAAVFGGRAVVQNIDRQAVLFESTLNYRSDIGDDQTLEAWGVYSFQEFENSGFGATAQDFVTDAFSFNNLSGAANFTTRPFSFADENRLISFLGRVNYSLADGKYLLSAAVRREGSSRFGEGKKWGTFPSASVGWRLSEESFMQDIQSISDLKLRLSYGITGNQDIGNYKSLVILGTGANAVIDDQTLTGVSATQLANPDLQWEETSQLNLGIDFGLYNNRVSGSIDIYSKKTTDLLLEFAVPQPAVVSTRLDNAGEVTNKGIEIALNTVNLSTENLFWRTSLNFASNSNEVDNLGGRDFIVHAVVSGAGLSDVQAQIVLPGQPLGTFFGPRFLGYDENGIERLSSDPGEPTASEGPLGDGRFILGDAQPDFTFGISNTINYKRFDFRIFFQGVMGVDILNNTRMEYQRPSNVFNGINLFAGARDDVAAGMDPEATTRYSDRFIEDGSFIRLQNITIGYTLDNDWVRNLRLRNLRFFLSGDNLFVLTDYDGYDPEVDTLAGFNGVNAMGVDYTNYPRARTLSFGLSFGL
ncbi:MAG: SusC/RagA family TonB-linked outer membrane protein, partial [bacterium]